MNSHFDQTLEYQLRQVLGTTMSAQPSPPPPQQMQQQAFTLNPPPRTRQTVKWSKKEYDYLWEIVEHEIVRLQRPLKYKDFAAITMSHNQRFIGTSTMPGEALAPSNRRSAETTASKESDYSATARNQKNLHSFVTKYHATKYEKIVHQLLPNYNVQQHFGHLHRRRDSRPNNSSS